MALSVAARRMAAPVVPASGVLARTFADFVRSKPHANIGTIGHVDHGKTTLTAAISHVLSVVQGKEAVRFDQIDKAPEVRN